MKKVFALLIGIAACVMVCSCEKETILTVDQASLSFNNSGGSQTVNIVANKVWSASSNQSWCKVSPSSGDGSDNSNITISVSCDANASYDARTCTITINCEELTKTIAVSQAEGKGLILSQTEFNLTNDAQIISVEVQANVQYTVEIDHACKSWIKQESTKALSSNTIKFAISKNEDYDGREGKIIIKQTDGSLSGTVVVKQSQQNGLFVSTPEYSLSNEKHTLTIEVKANVEFDVKPNVDWIKHVETKGLKTSQIVLEVAANDDYDEREGVVVVKQKNGGLEGVITIKQEQNYGILVSQSEYSIPNEAQTIEVEVKYNVEYDVVIPDGCKDWISVIGTKGLSSRVYTISIAKNETYDNREGSITFKQKKGSLSGTILFHQSQTDGIFTERKEYSVSAEEQQISIKVSSNTNYDVIIDEGCKEWISQIQTKGLSESIVTIHIMANDGHKRDGKVYLKSESIHETILIKQQASEIVPLLDAHFKAYCVENFDINHDGELSYDEALLVTSIDVKTESIASLEGIEFFENLQSLTCIPDYRSVEYGNPIKFFNSKNEEIIGLLTNLDISHNLQLQYLNCEGNQLTIIDVSHNAALIDFNSKYNPLTTLDVSHNISLANLNCEYNQLTTLDVSCNTALIHLECVANQLTTLDVSSNTRLTELACGGNQLTTLDVSKNTALYYLECGSNQLTTLDVSKNTELRTLNCSENRLTTLVVSNNTKLSYFGCHDNQLTTLDMSKNTALTDLFCHNNQLTSLDVSHNPFLKSLTCENNRLITLDVTRNMVLKNLDCGNNQIKTLNVMNNTSLSTLKCYSNLLTSLDVSKNTQLYYLDCGSNQLTSFDLSKNTELMYLLCSSNQLTTLDVSNNTAMIYLACGGNPKLFEIWLKTGQTIQTFMYDTDVATIKYK
jgi:hypothetical protein